MDAAALYIAVGGEDVALGRYARREVDDFLSSPDNLGTALKQVELLTVMCEFYVHRTSVRRLQSLKDPTQERRIR